LNAPNSSGKRTRRGTKKEIKNTQARKRNQSRPTPRSSRTSFAFEGKEKSHFERVRGRREDPQINAENGLNTTLSRSNRGGQSVSSRAKNVNGKKRKSQKEMVIPRLHKGLTTTLTREQKNRRSLEKKEEKMDGSCHLHGRVSWGRTLIIGSRHQRNGEFPGIRGNKRQGTKDGEGSF